MKRIMTCVLAAMTMAAAQAQYKMPTIDLWPQGVPGAKAGKQEAKAGVAGAKDKGPDGVQASRLRSDKAAPVTRQGRDVFYFDRVTTPTLEVFEPTVESNGQAVVVCPGGAYSVLAYDKEGQEVAQWLAGQGYTAYVLAYRVPNDRAGALQDAQRAIRTVRTEGKKRADTGYSAVGIMGFSAGGSLSCRAATRWAQPAYEPQDAVDRESCRPDFALLIYPAYLDEGEGGTLTPELTVSAETPPLFVFGTEDDVKYSGPSCLTIADAMRREGAPIELHYLARGGHGYGMRSGAGKVWPKLAETWLGRIGN